MKRRQFLQTSLLTTAASTIGVAGTLTSAQAAPDKARVQRYSAARACTALEISDISFGGGQVPSASLVLRAIDQGINYFDTAPDYGRSEAVIGEALAKHGQRDKVYIASKLSAGLAMRRASAISSWSSRRTTRPRSRAVLRLRTDLPRCRFRARHRRRQELRGQRRRLLDEAMLSAFQELKQEGKARYLAVSSHGPYQMEQLLTDAVESGHYDAMMGGLQLPQVSARARGAAAGQGKRGGRGGDEDPGRGT